MEKEIALKKEFTVNTTFSDNMVLQRNKPVKIFGYGGVVGEVVNVEFKGKTYSGIIEEKGWEVWITPLETDKTGNTLNINYNGKTISFQNVVVGEVWLCVGQSNMEVSVQYILNKNENVKKEYSEYGNWENIRVYTRSYNLSDTPLIDETGNDVWKTSSSFEDVLPSSAAAVAFASNLSHALSEEVPVGVLNCSVGGSPIESWISPEGMANLNSYFKDKNSVFYNGMLYNIYGYTFSGLFWYQGCANAQPHMSEDYKLQFDVLLKEVRTAAKDSSFPVVMMQIVQFEDWCSWVNMRQTQWDLMKLENVYTVCGIDLGSNTTPHSLAMEEDGLHPTDKWEVGKRVAGIAASRILNLTPVDNSIPYGISPSIASASLENGKIYLKVKDAERLTVTNGEIGGFEIYSDGDWHKANGELSGNAIIISSDKEKPQKLRYFQSNVIPDGIAFIRNELGLPLAPVQSVEIE